jgi:hypothetical protein
MTITIPTTVQIGSTLERVARAIAVLIAVTMAAGMITAQFIENLSTLVTRLTTRPLRTLIDLIPTVPAPVPVVAHDLPAVPILTGAEFMVMWGAEFVDDEPKPARKRTARRKPASATKVAVGA